MTREPLVFLPALGEVQERKGGYVAGNKTVSAMPLHVSAACQAW